MNAVGIADADGHLERELSQFSGIECRDCRFQSNPAKQHVLIHLHQVDAAVGAQRFSNLADMVSFTLVLVLVGEGGHQADGDDGTGLFDLHGEILSCLGKVGASRITGLITLGRH